MEKTNEAINEIQALKEKKEEHKEAPDNYYKKSCETNDELTRKLARSSYNAEYNKMYKCEDKVFEIEKLGVSSKELRKIKKEMMTMKIVEHSSNLGSRDRTVEGFSKTLNKNVKIEYVFFTSFMRNVKGCGSLADTKNITKIEVIE